MQCETTNVHWMHKTINEHAIAANRIAFNACIEKRMKNCVSISLFSSWDTQRKIIVITIKLKNLLVQKKMQCMFFFNSCCDWYLVLVMATIQNRMKEKHAKIENWWKLIDRNNKEWISLTLNCSIYFFIVHASCMHTSIYVLCMDWPESTHHTCLRQCKNNNEFCQSQRLKALPFLSDPFVMRHTDKHMHI